MTNENTSSCPMCGHSVKDDDVFCNSCGASLTETVEITAEIPIIDEQTVYTVQPQQMQSVVVDYPRERRNIVAIVSLVFGILAVGFSIAPFMWCLMFLFSPLAFILGMIGVFTQKRRYYAVAGIALAIIGALLYILQMRGIFWIPY
ncbi:MAG: zinc-ribbon domain-containing protein [Candidatus Heimdallarchaeota archaeon]|nr:zinc-ribbon domain-containing protein [Candidatus Heimdallarchaeota archaeon]